MDDDSQSLRPLQEVGGRMEVQRIEPQRRALVDHCARMMMSSEPWITLHRTFDSAVAALEDPGKELHAVVREGDVQAFVLIDMRGPLSGYIQSICVRPELRGRGLGAALLAWAEARILRDSPNVFLCVSSFNNDARRLYERLGYQTVGKLENFIVTGHDELLLRKTVSPWTEFSPTNSVRTE